jgi:hypothetical protein
MRSQKAIVADKIFSLFDGQTSGDQNREGLAARGSICAAVAIRSVPFTSLYRRRPLQAKRSRFNTQ